MGSAVQWLRLVLPCGNLPGGAVALPEDRGTLPGAPVESGRIPLCVRTSGSAGSILVLGSGALAP